MEVFFPFPFKNREAMVYGFGANRMKHNGTILVIAKSTDYVGDPSLKDKIEDFSRDKRRK